MTSKTGYDCEVNLFDFINESNKIEGIYHPAIPEEIQAAEKFMQLRVITVKTMCELVHVFESGVELRDKTGMNMRIGNYFPPLGGSFIRKSLKNILSSALEYSPYYIHNKYECLHPFTDCNGRSGRLLWLWIMDKLGDRMASLGFLHAWYYQSLEAASR